MSAIFSLSRLQKVVPAIIWRAIFLIGGTIIPLKAVEVTKSGNTSYNTNDNIGSSLTSWNTGWGSGGDGWNYVGKVSDASGVYLGNNWVLTAAHVNNPTSFTLNGNTYNTTGASYTDFTNSRTGTTNADLHLFQIYNTSITGTNISLSSLIISSYVPSLNQPVVMIGYGGSNGQASESWGSMPVYANTQYPISVNGYESIDFTSLNSGTSYASVVNGDSGGGDFMKVGSYWELVGINEAIISYSSINPLTGTNYTGSAFVQLGEYSDQISSIVNAVPEPGSAALSALSLLALGYVIFRKRLTT